MNSVITASSLPLETDYALPSSENESHAHHSSYPGGVDQLRRNPPVGHSGKAFISLSTQYIPNRPLAHEAQFHPGVGISDSSPGSISTSPSSNASSLATYSPFATNSAYQQPTQSSFPAAAHFPNGGQLFTTSTGFPHSFQVMSGARTRGSSITDSTTTSGMLPPTRSPGIGNPVSPPFGGTARGNYTTSTPHISRHTPIHPPRSRDETLARVQFGNLTDNTPRALHSAAMSLSPPTAGHYNPVSSVLGYQPPHERQHETPPFNELQIHLEMTCDGQRVQPQIDSKIEKGFFFSSDRTWTCYRRNYFSVACSYSLNPHVPNGRLYVSRGGKHQPEQIQALAVSLSAVVDGQSGKIIELVQHTPKRDKGPQMQIGKEKIAPTPPGKSQADSHGYNLGGFHNPTNIASPHLPLQTEPDPSTLQHPGFSPSSHTATTYQHTFERIQFKSATANNGKRRAQQQYYHLIVELWADVRNPRDTSANWVKVAQRMSAAVVVRGRSPSHYQNEGPHTSSSPRGGAGGSSGTGSGHMGLGGAGGAGMGARGMGSLSMLGSGALSAGIYRSGQYSMDPSPAGSHSVSPTSPIGATQVDSMVPEDSTMNEGENKAGQGYDGYQYFPGPIYEAGLLPAIKSEGFEDDRKVKDEYTGNNFAAGYHTGGCGRFQGVESSRGYYPDLPAGF